MMKRLLVFVTALLVFCELRAQTLSEEDLVGDWRVVQIHEISDKMPSEMRQEMEMMRNAFLTSKFQFKPNKNFTFDFSLFDGEIEITNEHWKLDRQTGNVIIQEWKDKDKEKPVLMGIEVLRQAGKTIFVLQETFFSLEVEKE